MPTPLPAPAPSPHQPVVDRVAEALRGMILRGRDDGSVRPGDPLPSERELAEAWSVNRSTIREAMKRLEGWGLVRIRQGGATRVNDFLLSAGLEMLPHLVELHGAVDPAILRDIHEVRAMLLGWCAEEAALKADSTSIAGLDALVARMGQARALQGQPRAEALAALDYDFFEALVDITGNRVLALFSNLIREVYARGRERFLPIYGPSFELANHRAAIDAIRTRRPEAARAAMRAHAMSAIQAMGAEPDTEPPTARTP